MATLPFDKVSFLAISPYF